MKERFKNNKWALALFIATIGIIASSIIGIIILYVMLPATLEEARKVLEEQGYSEELIEVSIGITKGILMFSKFGQLLNNSSGNLKYRGISSIIITLFVALCGFKCSLNGKWRKGAIVFGVIFVVFDVISIFRDGGQIAVIISNVISISLSSLYLAGAIKCDYSFTLKANEFQPNDEVKTSESNDDEFKI